MVLCKSTSYKKKVLRPRNREQRTEKFRLLKSGNLLEEINNAVAVAPFVVVPAHELEKGVAQREARSSIEDRGVWAVNEVG